MYSLLYRAHYHGQSVAEISKRTGWSEKWIADRIEDIHAILDSHIFPSHLCSICPDRIWAAQIWD